MHGDEQARNSKRDMGRFSVTVWTVAALIIAVAAVILAVAGLTSLVIGGLAIVATVFAVTSIIRHRRSWVSAVAAITISAVAVAAAMLTGGMSVSPDLSGKPSSSPSQSAETSTPATSPSPQPETPTQDLPKIGETPISDAGVSLSVEAMECRLESAGEGAPTPSGQYCAVEFTVANNSESGIDILASDFTGQIGETDYPVVPGIGRLGDDMSNTTVLPDSQIDGTLFFDVPTGAALETLSLSAEWFEVGFDVSAPAP